MIRDYFNDIVFDWPWLLILLIGVPVWLWWSQSQRTKNTASIAATTGNRGWRQQSWRLRLMHFPMWLRGAAVACLIVALATPAHYQTVEMNNGEGIDIMLCMDVSGSMLARDFTPDRLRASMDVARNFVQGRKGDRIGLVIFSGQSLALCPLTSDLQAVLHQINAIEYGKLADGTSIGTGLASSVDRLRQSKSPGKVVILLTDGEDTGGFFDPSTAKQLAMTYSIKVYTIGVGSKGMAPMPYQTPTGTKVREEKVNIDEALLTDIAQSTGGQYFRATNSEGLDSIYASINQLEKNRVETNIFTKRTERFLPWLAAAIVLLILEMLLTVVFFKKIP